MTKEHLLDQFAVKTAHIAEKTLFLAGVVAGTVEATEALVDLSVNQNPISHLEDCGAVIGITAVGLVALQGIRYYFTRRPEFLNPDPMDKSTENC